MAVAELRERMEALRRRYEPVAERWRATPAGRYVDRAIEGVAEIEPFDRGMTLAAQAFTSIIPIMVVTASYGRARNGFGTGLADSLGLPDAVRRALAGSVPAGSEVGSGFGIFGLLVAVVGATAYSRALERMYSRAWGVRKPSLRTAWRWLAAVVAVVAALSILNLTASATQGLPVQGWVETLVRLVVWSVVWTAVPYVLMDRQVRLRVLAFPGVVTAVALAILQAAGGIYLPIALTNGAQQFGVLGMTFAYIGWLFALSFVIVVATALGRAASLDDGPVGRFVRGGAPLEDAQGDAPADGDAPMAATESSNQPHS